MVKNLSAYEIYQFITSDFKAAWDSLATNSSSNIGRGNFMFGRQAMNLLEFAARLCKVDTTGNALRSLSSELLKIEPKYFTKLPGPCEIPSESEFILPHDGDTSGRLLLWTLFDLIRHGLAHQYQQTLVKLTDGKFYHLKLTGAKAGLDLAKVQRSLRPPNHLAYTFDSDGDMELTVKPDILFLDIDEAINKSDLLNKGLTFPAMSRPRKKNVSYNYDIKRLEKTLNTAGHNKI